MVALKTVARRFDQNFSVIEGGSGIVIGNLSETDQTSQPSYIFVQPRHVFRSPYPTALRPGMVISSPDGTVFIVGANGPSETNQGTLWQSFRLFEPTGRYLWQRRTKVIDMITGIETDASLETLGTIWCALESLDREPYDRDMHLSIGQARLIAGASIREQDLIDNRAVTKVDKQLGISIGVIT